MSYRCRPVSILGLRIRRVPGHEIVDRRRTDVAATVGLHARAGHALDNVADSGWNMRERLRATKQEEAK